jgi:phosphoribosylamine--glycine ligase
MNILGIGDTLDLGSMYLQLLERGHGVRVFVGDAAAADTLEGMVPTVDSWQDQLDWVRQAGAEGFIVFETAAHGALQETLRAEGFQVIGGSAFGDRLENDRAFGQDVMREVGMRVVDTDGFQSFEEASTFVRRHPRRYVYKPSGTGFASGRTYVGQMESGADMLAYLDLQSRRWPDGVPVDLVLMERLDGVEVGIGAYFNGSEFLRPACVDWEHKRFFPRDLGELTGEMGTVVSYRRGVALFNETLARMTGPLRAGGYCGYININTIVDDRGVHPLEFTCRFGYPGFAILQPLQLCGWDDLFKQLVRRDPTLDFPTRDGFAVGVVVTVPPFPYSSGYEQLSKGLPVLFTSEPTATDRAHFHFAEVARRDGHLVTSGTVGYLMVVTGCGATVALARADAYARVAMVCVPHSRHRHDIGERFIATDERRLQSMGWL